MAGQRKAFENGDDLREAIRHVDQVSARIARLIEDLNAPKPTEPVQDENG